MSRHCCARSPKTRPSPAIWPDPQARRPSDAQPCGICGRLVPGPLKERAQAPCLRADRPEMPPPIQRLAHALGFWPRWGTPSCERRRSRCSHAARHPGARDGDAGAMWVRTLPARPPSSPPSDLCSRASPPPAAGNRPDPARSSRPGSGRRYQDRGPPQLSRAQDRGRPPGGGGNRRAFGPARFPPAARTSEGENPCPAHHRRPARTR